MNRICPVCESDLLESESVVPYEENDRIMTLQFCSPECRDEYAAEDSHGLEDRVSRDWDCPECDADGMTEAQFVRHRDEAHEEQSPLLDLFPEYYVCMSHYDESGGDSVSAYLKMESPTGPWYMAWSDRDYVEKPAANELLRHDWERIERAKTPFPQLERMKKDDNRKWRCFCKHCDRESYFASRRAAFGWKLSHKVRTGHDAKYERNE